MTHILALLALLAGTDPTPRVHVGVGTVFSDSASDAWNPHDELACSPGVRLDPQSLGVALPARRAKCGALVQICRRRAPARCAWARVVDRGPRSALVDMTPAIASAIGHNGLEPVVLRVFGASVSHRTRRR